MLTLRTTPTGGVALPAFDPMDPYLEMAWLLYALDLMYGYRSDLENDLTWLRVALG